MNSILKEYIVSDMHRYFGSERISLKTRIFMPLEIKYIITFRKAQFSSFKFIRTYYKFKLWMISRKTMIQIPASTRIGKGFYIGHCGRIIINSNAVLGENVNIATGVTIGQENRGYRKGSPIIGNNVWIGTNAVVVGKIKIGDDVLIAPNAYVNFDIPSHSIVLGNPAKIHPRDNATDGYVCRKI